MEMWGLMGIDRKGSRSNRGQYGKSTQQLEFDKALIKAKRKLWGANREDGVRREGARGGEP